MWITFFLGCEKQTARWLRFLVSLPRGPSTVTILDLMVTFTRPPKPLSVAVPRIGKIRSVGCYPQARKDQRARHGGSARLTAFRDGERLRRMNVCAVVSNQAQPTAPEKIGRASCRERGWMREIEDS